MSSSELLTDQELLSLLREDSYTAFTELYSRYWKKMLLIAWNQTGVKLAAEDLVHDVFVSLWENKNDVEIKNVEAYLVTAVKFAVFKKCRRDLRRKELARLNYNYADTEADEAKLDALFLQEYINGLVEQLPERCQLVFRYSREKGMKNADIALELNISEKTVEGNLTRALKLIRGGLENTGMLILLAESVHKYFL